MSWSVPRMWDGGDVWIIGGGPSVTKQFGIPEDIVQKVVAGTLPPSVYSPYMKPIHKEHVIGINVAFMIGNWIDMVFFGDSGFLLKYRPQLAEFPGLKVCCHPTAERAPWIKYLPHDKEHNKGISRSPKFVSWNSNSGAAAISVAAHAGAKRIILLGFDMKLSGDSSQHWHDLYGRGKIKDDKTRRKLPFERHLRGFAPIAADAKRMGIEILNCSPDSAITQFPKFTLNELLYNNS